MLGSKIASSQELHGQHSSEILDARSDWTTQGVQAAGWQGLGGEVAETRR
jgi:hypothetical protein